MYSILYKPCFVKHYAPSKAIQSHKVNAKVTSASMSTLTEHLTERIHIPNMQNEPYYIENTGKSKFADRRTDSHKTGLKQHMLITWPLSINSDTYEESTGYFQCPFSA